MRHVLRRLVGHAAVYSLGDFLIRGASFFLLPFYAYHFTPGEFGTLAIAKILVGAINVLLSFGFYAAAFRFYFSMTDITERRRYLGTILLFLAICPGVIVLILDRFGPNIGHYLLRSVPFDPYVRLAIWTAYFDLAFIQVPLQLLRAQERPFAYSAVTVIPFALNVTLNIVFIAGLGMGADGALLASLVVNMVFGPICVFTIRRSLAFAFDVGGLIRAFRYSVPLIPHYISHWLLGFSDRIILERFVSLAEVGVYSLGYQIGTAYNMVVAAGNSAIMPRYGHAVNHKDEIDELRAMFTYFVLGVAIIGSIVIVFGDDLIRIASPQAYHAASGIATWVVLGIFARGMYYGPMNTLSILAGDTRLAWVATVTAGMVNIGLNLALVPRFGMYVAAVNTTIGYGVLLIMMYVIAQRAFPFRYEMNRIGAIVATLAVIWIVAEIVHVGNTTISVLLDIACIGLWPIGLSVLGFWSRSERAAFGEVITRTRHRAVHRLGLTGGQE